MKRTYISPSIHCIVVEESLLDTDWSGGKVTNGKNGIEPITVNNDPLPDPGDGGKSLGAKSNHFFDWDE
mgnify:CR=1 FL=1